MEMEGKQKKVSDSAYSQSYRNSNSQTSDSSKTKRSGSDSSGSSGYCGNDDSDDIKNQDTQVIATNTDPQPNGSLMQNNNVDERHDVTITSNAQLEQNEYMNGTSKPLAFEKKIKNENFLNEKLLLTLKILENLHNKSSADIHNAMQCNINMETSQFKDDFCCIISMCSGIVLYTTPSLSTILGFPKNMWLGCSFVDFIHPKDKETFFHQIVTAVTVPFTNGLENAKGVTSSFYIYIKKYNPSESLAYSVSYQAFKLTITFSRSTDYSAGRDTDMLLIVVAVPVYSTYKVPDEICSSKKFGMRHTVGCVFSHVDSDVATNFGYLPQDMLGKSVFDFYHPEDLPFLREIYESVISKCQVAGFVYKSKPYRFAVHNGDFAMIETEWSSFINPWSRHLEFIVGFHRVLQGPANPDVFEQPKSESVNISDVVLKEAQLIRKEILTLLNKEFHEPESVKVPARHCFNRASSETPPSYNQLNYNENIDRFFNSLPKSNTPNDGKQENSFSHINDRNQRNIKNNATQPCELKYVLPVQINGVSGNNSTEVLSSWSIVTGSGTSGSIVLDPFESHLTEELLHRHNKDMESIMHQRHRDLTHNKVDRKSENELILGQGVKRSGTQSWKCENCKLPRYENSQIRCNVHENDRSTFTSNNNNNNNRMNRNVGNIHMDSIYSTKLPDMNITYEKASSSDKSKSPEGSVSNSSFWSSFFKTDETGSVSRSNGDSISDINGNNNNNQKIANHPVKKCNPPWMDNISCTPDFIYRYEVPVTNVDETLQSDSRFLQSIKQENLVNKQLNLLCMELNDACISPDVFLEGFTSNISDDDDGTSEKIFKKRKSYSTSMMIHESNASLPPPNGF